MKYGDAEVNIAHYRQIELQHARLTHQYRRARLRSTIACHYRHNRFVFLLDRRARNCNCRRREYNDTDDGHRCHTSDIHPPYSSVHSITHSFIHHRPSLTYSMLSAPPTSQLTSFSGPPLMLTRPVAYDRELLLPTIEKREGEEEKEDRLVIEEAKRIKRPMTTTAMVASLTSSSSDNPFPPPPRKNRVAANDDSDTNSDDDDSPFPPAFIPMIDLPSSYSITSTSHPPSSSSSARPPRRTVHIDPRIGHSAYFTRTSTNDDGDVDDDDASARSATDRQHQQAKRPNNNGGEIRTAGDVARGRRRGNPYGAQTSSSSSSNKKNNDANEDMYTTSIRPFASSYSTSIAPVIMKRTMPRSLHHAILAQQEHKRTHESLAEKDRQFESFRRPRTTPTAATSSATEASTKFSESDLIHALEYDDDMLSGHYSPPYRRLHNQYDHPERHPSNSLELLAAQDELVRIDALIHRAQQHETRGKTRAQMLMMEQVYGSGGELMELHNNKQQPQRDESNADGSRLTMTLNTPRARTAPGSQRDVRRLFDPDVRLARMYRLQSQNDRLYPATLPSSGPSSDAADVALLDALQHNQRQLRQLLSKNAHALVHGEYLSLIAARDAKRVEARDLEQRSVDQSEEEERRRYEKQVEYISSYRAAFISSHSTESESFLDRESRLAALAQAASLAAARAQERWEASRLQFRLESSDVLLARAEASSAERKVQKSKADDAERELAESRRKGEERVAANVSRMHDENQARIEATRMSLIRSDRSASNFLASHNRTRDRLAETGRSRRAKAIAIQMNQSIDAERLAQSMRAQRAKSHADAVDASMALRVVRPVGPQRSYVSASEVLRDRPTVQRQPTIVNGILVAGKIAPTYASVLFTPAPTSIMQSNGNMTTLSSFGGGAPRQAARPLYQARSKKSAAMMLQAKYDQEEEDEQPQSPKMATAMMQPETDDGNDATTE